MDFLCTICIADRLFQSSMRELIPETGKLRCKICYCNRRSSNIASRNCLYYPLRQCLPITLVSNHLLSGNMCLGKSEILVLTLFAKQAGRTFLTGTLGSTLLVPTSPQLHLSFARSSQYARLECALVVKITSLISGSALRMVDMCPLHQWFICQDCDRSTTAFIIKHPARGVLFHSATM